MKKAAILIAVIVFPLFVKSQENKFEYTPKVKKRVEIKNLLGEISIKNTTGNAIVIESDFNVDLPERAKGLKLLGVMEDNTQLGVNISEENGIVSILGSTKQVRDYKYTLSIPLGIAVSLEYNSPFVTGDIEIDSYKGSLEINTLSANVKLTNSTGPFTVNSVSGDVEVSFTSINQDEPTSLASVSGLIDVSVPSGEKATFEINNITGNVYNNLDLKSTSKEDGDKRASGLGSIKHSDGNGFLLNGGGQKVYLNSVSGNIYLRKK
jgi:DUF4097 and DUF4098 domain-containing protein YvlB